jgi:hypothetical protein
VNAQVLVWVDVEARAMLFLVVEGKLGRYIVEKEGR